MSSIIRSLRVMPRPATHPGSAHWRWLTALITNIRQLLAVKSRQYCLYLELITACRTYCQKLVKLLLPWRWVIKLTGCYEITLSLSLTESISLECEWRIIQSNWSVYENLTGHHFKASGRAQYVSLYSEFEKPDQPSVTGQTKSLSISVIRRVRR